MTGDPYDPHYFDPAERELLTDEEELLVELFGDWSRTESRTTSAASGSAARRSAARRQACMTVVWLRPPKRAPMAGRVSRLTRP